ncbi:hypothetical protein A1O3_05216 [Capronia epimyces CBS 606.96]|uniref:Uncharacterized protein n=1 Tax=Capronia epimyces CBS 606.96 TaxID=1182542 RepID=W9XVG1_9EURO|nr:uncharacterized protein A1O3_05216 [Capronia epimyces CBS 606.96]EXJ84547.1 hypothetical protein A1O3_05216 [Capronia epimyces CBS 606.96]
MPPRRVPHEKRHPCTHITMTRLYDPLGSFTCSVCSKHPNVGWLYRCTQDHSGFLPEFDFTSQTAPANRPAVTLDFNAHCLSPSIVKAIEDGQYTSDQVKTLIKQKERVREAIFGAGGRPPTSSTSTTTSSSSEGTFSILPQSTTFSTNSTASLDEEIKAAYDWKELQKAWMSEPSVPPPEYQSTQPPSSPSGLSRGTTLPADQICDFKVCPNCRPTYRERACQSLNHILNNPVQLPPIWELENRKLSDARTVAAIELPALPRFYAQTTPNSFQSHHSVPEMSVDLEDGSISGQQVGDAHSVRKRSGFRQTVRKALARARLEDSSTPSTVSDTDSSLGSNTNTSRPSRSLIFRRRRPRPTLSCVETRGRIVDTSALQDSVLLMLATNTPLPHTPTMSSHQLNRLADQSTEQTLYGTALQTAGLMAHA